MSNASAPDRAALTRQLEKHEGFRLKPYQDTVGKLTIGIGRNLTDRGITREEAYFLFNNDLDDHMRELYEALPWVAGLDPTRQAVLIDMAFNLGVPGLLKFKRTLSSIQAGNYKLGAAQMLVSLWAKQVKGRAVTLARMMASGVNPFQQEQQ